MYTPVFDERKDAFLGLSIGVPPYRAGQDVRIYLISIEHTNGNYVPWELQNTAEVEQFCQACKQAEYLSLEGDPLTGEATTFSPGTETKEPLYWYIKRFSRDENIPNLFFSMRIGNLRAVRLGIEIRAEKLVELGTAALALMPQTI